MPIRLRRTWIPKIPKMTKLSKIMDEDRFYFLSFEFVSNYELRISDFMPPF